MTQGLVTVVVPIYNVEKYLDRCLDSIVNQTYKNLEIILVDDGSPDRCPEICEEWAKKDDRMKVIHKKNAGLGMARNTGIENASGEYICFFDSDDYIALDTIEKAYYSIKKYNADIVTFGLHSVDGVGRIVSSDIPMTEKDYYEGEEILSFVLPNMLSFDPKTGKKLGLNMSAWGRMFSFRLISEHHWRFASERQYISEDFYSLLALYRHVHSVAILHEALYYYCYNDASLTHTFQPERFKRVCVCHQGMIEICDKYKYPEIIKTGVDSQFVGSAIGAMKRIVLSDKSEKEKKREMKKAVNDPYFQGVLAAMNSRNESTARKIVIFAMKHKLYGMTYMLVKAKS